MWQKYKKKMFMGYGCVFIVHKSQNSYLCSLIQTSDYDANF